MMKPATGMTVRGMVRQPEVLLHTGKMILQEGLQFFFQSE